MKNISKELEIIIDYNFKTSELLEQSLIHKSFDNNNNNEKLEFLGDRVLGLIISKKLIEIYPNEKEGIIDKKYANLVNKKTCFNIAKKINIKKFMLLGSSHKSLRRSADKIMSDCLEALIGAIYLDKGLLDTKEFIQRLILTGEEISVKNQDFKSELYLLAKKQQQKINFVQLEQSGPDHKKSHKIGLMIDEKMVASCWSPTIKDAEIKLSKKILSQIK